MHKGKVVVYHSTHCERYGVQVQCFYGQLHQHLRLLLLPEDVGANDHRS